MVSSLQQLANLIYSIGSEMEIQQKKSNIM